MNEVSRDGGRGKPIRRVRFYWPQAWVASLGLKGGTRPEPQWPAGAQQDPRNLRCKSPRGGLTSGVPELCHPAVPGRR